MITFIKNGITLQGSGSRNSTVTVSHKKEGEAYFYSEIFTIKVNDNLYKNVLVNVAPLFNLTLIIRNSSKAIEEITEISSEKSDSSYNHILDLGKYDLLSENNTLDGLTVNLYSLDKSLLINSAIVSENGDKENTKIIKFPNINFRNHFTLNITNNANFSRDLLLTLKNITEDTFFLDIS